MEVIKIFLEEIYDFELSPAQINNYVDEKTNSLKMGNILKDPALFTNLAFRYLWKNTTGVYPSKRHAQIFMKEVKHNGDVDMNEFLAFLKNKIPIYAYINLDMDSLGNVKNIFLQELNQTVNVKKQLAIKFCYRYGIDQDVVDTKESLFGIFRKCVFHPMGYGRIRSLNRAFSRMFEKELLDIPDVPDTLVSYYKVSSDMIEHYELANLNVFTNFWNPFEYTTPQNTTVFDAINYVISSDSNIFRMLLGSIVIYWDNGDGYVHDRVRHLINAANSKETQRNIVVFKHIDTPDINHQTDYYYYKYAVAHRFLMNFIPKLASNYVLVGSDLYPQSPILCSKAENSLYYCLYEEQDITVILPTYYNMFSRWMVSDKTKKIEISKLISDKHIYVIVDAIDEKNIVFNSDFQEHQWIAHFTESCPYNAMKKGGYTPKMNILLYDQFLLNYYLENRLNVDAFIPVKGHDNVVILVDNRPNIFSVISLYITMSNLNIATWSVVVVCNKHNIDFYKRFFGDKVEYITKFDLPSKKFAIDYYNDLLKSSTFWNSFTNYKKALFVQDDGMVLMRGMENEFLSYDYVGAPWRKEWATINPNKFLLENINPQLVGNGGVSLRDIKKMKFICEKYRHLALSLHYDMLQQLPEDVFFSKYSVLEEFNLPNYETAQKFASEQVCNVKSFAIHKFWVYVNLSDAERVFTQYLTDTKL